MRVERRIKLIRQKGKIIWLRIVFSVWICGMLLNGSVAAGGAVEDLEESAFLLRAIAFSVSASPVPSSEHLREAYRMEGWDFEIYKAGHGTVDAKFQAAWRKKTDGSSDYWISVAGSSSINDWISDFDTSMVKFVNEDDLSAADSDMRIHRGFHRYAQAILDYPMRTPDGPDKQKLTVFLLKHPNQQVVLAGHCLGGAVVSIIGARLVSAGIDPGRIKIVTFGAPATGTLSFAEYFGSKLDVTRVVTRGDPLPLFPPKMIQGYSQWGRLVNWEMNDLPFYERHYKKKLLELALKKYYDKQATGQESVQKYSPAEKSMISGDKGIFVAAIRNELPIALTSEFPYMRKVLQESHHSLFGDVVIQSESGESPEQFEKIRIQAKVAGCDRILFASVRGQSVDDTQSPYHVVSLDQSLYRASDGRLLYAATYQKASKSFTPLAAFWMAAVAMRQDGDSWTGSGIYH